MSETKLPDGKYVRKGKLVVLLDENEQIARGYYTTVTTIVENGKVIAEGTGEIEATKSDLTSVFGDIVNIDRSALQNQVKQLTDLVKKNQETITELNRKLGEITKYASDSFAAMRNYAEQLDASMPK